MIQIVETLVQRQIRFIPIKEGIEFDGQQGLRTKVMIASGCISTAIWALPLVQRGLPFHTPAAGTTDPAGNGYHRERPLATGSAADFHPRLPVASGSRSGEGSV